jgi:hypothetical protein
MLSVEEHISANVYSKAFFEQFNTLANLADWYVFDLVGVFRGTFHRMTVAALSMIVERFNPTPTNRQSLQDKLEKLLTKRPICSAQRTRTSMKSTKRSAKGRLKPRWRVMIG